MTTKQILEAARQVIAKPENWCTHRRTNNEGAHCAIGAIEVARGIKNPCSMALLERDPLGMEAANALASAIEPNGYDGLSRVATHNNRHSHKCVIAAFDAAIERA